MKAFLLAAGHGTRLRPYTDAVPKCLVPIRGVPLLEIWLQLCHKHGIADVLVNTHAHAPAVIDFVRSRTSAVRVSVVEESELRGSAGTLLANRSWVESNEPFYVLYADVLTDADLSTMLASHQPDCAATIGLYEVPDPERCGIATLDGDDTVLSFVEKPTNPATNLAFAGIMVAGREFLDAIPGTPGVDIACDVLPRLIGRMRGHHIREFVLDVGIRENYERAQQLWPPKAERPVPPA